MPSPRESPAPNVNHMRAFDDNDKTTLLADQVNSSGPRRKLSTAEDSTEIELFGQRKASWWTGRPLPQVPGMRPDGRLPSLPQLLLKNCTKEVWRLYACVVLGDWKNAINHPRFWGQLTWN